MVAALVLMTPAFLAAQTPKWSLGAGVFGATYETEAEVFVVSAPGGGAILGLPNVFVGFYPTENIVIRPGVTFFLASNGGTDYDITIDANLEYHLSGVMMNSAYLFATGAFNAFGNGVSETDFAAGGGVGYRMLPFDFFAVMFEGSYRRWFDTELNQITGAVKIEVLFN
jgi:hypothetical protein